MKIFAFCIIPLIVASCATDTRNSGSYDSNAFYYDKSDSTPVPVDNPDMINSEDENNAIEQINDTQALNNSMQAAQEQNDEAVQATQQTEINAGF